MKKRKLKSNFKNSLKDWSKIIVVVLIAILINIFPLIISLVKDNWWFMLLYCIVPILDGIYLFFLNAVVDIFKW